jgi:hypothetical protein
MIFEVARSHFSCCLSWSISASNSAISYLIGCFHAGIGGRGSE